MQKMSEILKEADESQHTTHYLRRQVLNLDDNDNTVKTVDMYCAMGKIVCTDGMGDQILNRGYVAAPINKSFESRGIGKREGIIFIEPKHYCPVESCDHMDLKLLSELIVHINDVHRLSFKDIGLELEKLGY